MVCNALKKSRPTSFSIAQIGFGASCGGYYLIFHGADVVAVALKPAMTVLVIGGVSHQSLCVPLIVTGYLSVTLEP